MINRLEEVLVDNSELVEKIDTVVFCFRQQNYDRGLRRFGLVINLLEKFIGNYEESLQMLNCYDTEYSKEALLNTLPGILQAQEDRDYILLSDLLELQLRPFVIKIQEGIMNELKYVPSNAKEERNLQIIMEQDEKLYMQLKKNQKSNLKLQCEYTASGLYTVKCYCNGKEFYLHSNNNPQYESEILVNSWYQEDKYRYIVYGLGLGYHIYQLCEIDKYIEIDVYEANLEIIQLAAVYGVLARCIASGQVRVHYDPNFEGLAKKLADISEETEFVVHAPSQRMIEDENVRERVEEYFLHYQSVKNQKGILNGNFRYNIKHYDSSVDELLSEWKGKNVYIIAAGPSLDHNFQELKKVGNDGIIVATGTVYRKLMSAGIKPNYVIISEGNERVIKQISGLEQEKIPMLLLSTANREFAKRYHGKKYLICQKDFTLAEEFAQKKGYHLYRTGGSVATISLDLAIFLQAKRIIFVGLDLAYPNNLVHAEGTSRRNLFEDDELKTVKDIYGKPIKTNKHLDLYRRWIEERISEVPNGVEFIDSTEGGALIKGMKLMKLNEVVNYK